MKNDNQVELYIIGASLVLGFTLSWILPNMWTNLIKPIPILFMILQSFKKRKVRIKNIDIVLLLFVFVIVCNTVFWGYDNSIVYGTAYIINILYCICICCYGKEGENIVFILKSCKYASLGLAICVMFSNPIMGSLHSPTIHLLWGIINRNSVAYLISIGIVIVAIQIVENSNSKNNLRYLFEMVILLYGALYPMSRGGFITSAMGLTMVVCPHIVKKMRTMSKNRIFLMGLFVVLLIVFVINIPSEYKNRLFAIENYRFSNSGRRADLWTEAIKLLDKNLLWGHGIGFYQEVVGTSYGAHNCFVDVWVSMGILGLGLFVYIYLYIIKKAKWNNYILAFLSISFFSAFLESQNTYQVWVPIALCLILLEMNKNNEWIKYLS